MIQQDVRSVQGYVLGVAGFILALFIPVAALVLRIFNPVTAAVFLGIIIPLIALCFGIVGLVKSSKQRTSLSVSAKVFSVITIIVSLVLIIFNAYAFIKAGNLGLA